MRKIRFWRCFKCRVIKTAEHFVHFDLHALCDDCQRRLSGTARASDAPAGNDAAVPARKRIVRRHGTDRRE